MSVVIVFDQVLLVFAFVFANGFITIVFSNGFIIQVFVIVIVIAIVIAVAIELFSISKL